MICGSICTADLTKGPARFSVAGCVLSPKFPQEWLLLLDNEKGGGSLPFPVEGRNSPSNRRRAVMVGQVWSADLAESLMEIYSHLLIDGYSLEDVSRMVQESSDDCPGD